MQTSVPSPSERDRYEQGKAYSYKERTVSFGALEDVEFGHALTRSQSVSNGGRMPQVNRLELLLNANLDADDEFTGTLQLQDIDGNVATLADISVTYATSHSLTVDAIVTAISNLSVNVSAVAKADAAGNAKRVIQIDSLNDYKLLIAEAFDNSGTTTVTTKKTTSDKPVGPADGDPNIPELMTYSGSTPALYKKGMQMMAAVVYGDPAVPVNQDVLPGDTPYILLEEYTDQEDVLNKQGTYRKDDDDGLAPVVILDRAEFSQASKNGLAPVAVNK